MYSLTFYLISICHDIGLNLLMVIRCCQFSDMAKTYGTLVTKFIQVLRIIFNCFDL